MIIHVVLIQLRKGVTEEQKDDLISRFCALKGAVPGVLEASAGRDFSGRSAPYSMASVVCLADRAALEEYMTHPAHAAIVSLLDAVSPGRLVVDYEQ